MAGTLSIYSFEDADGNEASDYTTQDFDLAADHAREYKLRVIENVYEWSEAIPVEGADYTGTPRDDDEEDEDTDAA